MGTELRFAGRLVNCSRWLDLRPQNSSSPAWSLSFVLTVSRCKWTVGVACQQWQRLPDSRMPSMSVPICVGTCQLSSLACTCYAYATIGSVIYTQQKHFLPWLSSHELTPNRSFSPNTSVLIVRWWCINLRVLWTSSDSKAHFSATYQLEGYLCKIFHSPFG